MNRRKTRRAPSDPLAALEVIDRLAVGPVEVEPQRVMAPYAVTRAGKTERTELVYRFEEPVLDPDDEASRNLASMMAAQVALNYGLFCREIAFFGCYDRRDRRFIEEFAAHTAREIYAIKLLHPNPFLRGAAAGLPAVRARSYLRADLLFPDGLTQLARTTAAETKPEASRYAVLSSGGKDSLLSYGLLDELGCETHPIFVNESGRHWFTAVNAYRHFSSHVARTARVWTNADRVFAWMLRQLPFIRDDFARVRSDEYPIRLWTVAVFLFGALPLLRLRGIGRLLIGNEHDTTVRLSLKGITHYNGLYDQSRYFDNAMTRYFQRKGWGICQFSLLRPLSELLIQKTLIERYPELQQHQVSCHAAHQDGERMRPCGQCEKCRRIVGMLLALEADPTRCGYGDHQVEACLAALAKKGVHQESAGAEQLFFLLGKRGLLEVPQDAREHAEIMKLRIDPERSPPETVPTDLRRPLTELLLEHADGAVERRGRAWIVSDPLSVEALSRPYLYEAPPRRLAQGDANSGAVTHRLGELSWPDAEWRLKQVDVALLPVGAIEQHGPHLPLDTDAYDAHRLAEEVAAACSHPRPLVLPLIPYGVSYHHDDFPGTISIGPETLSRMVYEIGISAARHGITKLVIVNGHGGNGPALHFAAQLINRDAHIFTCVDTGETSDADIDALAETPNDVHAGEIETSTSLALRPELVRMSRAETSVPSFSSDYLDFSSKRSVGWYVYTARVSPTGVMGDPQKASREKGERMWSVMVRNLVELIEDLKSLSLDEIYQRRY